ncbi:MAG: hypothetical protein COA84_02880 [Robiginitomaculum sp.]|nr:MAG: hypothetical protein COA84_02880 [Robiginitomaculum sp.]
MVFLRGLLFITLACFGSAGSAFGAEAYEAYRERTSMLLIAAHCEALGDLEHAALVSGQVQARGALLRAGEDPQALDDLQIDLSRRAQNIACERDDVKAEIARMQEAAQIWSRLYTMRFPARWQNWEARRDDARDKARWRIRAPLRSTSGGVVDFGLVAEGEKVFLDLVIMDQRAPSSVILNMRDADRLAAPLDTDMLRLMGRKGDDPASLMPPKSVMKSFFAVDKMIAPESLTGENGAKAKAVLFRFSDKALDAFTKLDPRDVVSLELVYPGRGRNAQKRERIYAEAGDFVAARLFAETFPQERKAPAVR